MSTPDTLLLVAPNCPHCASVLDILSRLVKENKIGRLEVLNILSHPEAAKQAGTRSVPWMRIGPFELEGLHSAGELAEWADHARNDTGMDSYLSQLMEQQKLPKVMGLVADNPDLLPIIMDLSADLETPMGVRIAIAALVEELEGSKQLEAVIPQLGVLAQSREQQIRADACHYLGLSHSDKAVPLIEPLLSDPDPEVREIAAESLHLIRTAHASAN